MSQERLYLLATKTAAPRRARGVLPRPRLAALASEIGQRVLTLVKAPPGYGKTTCALAWADELAAQGATVAWLSLDPQDNGVARLAFYIAQALDHAGVALNELREHTLATLCMVDPEGVVARLLNAVTAHRGEVLLVLDDAHGLTDAAVVALLAYLCRRAPAHLHLLLLARSEMPAALVAEVNPEEWLEIDAATLRFDLAETTQLVRKLRGEAWSSSDIDRLHAAAEGWPAALRAMLIAGGDGRPAAALQAGQPSRPIAALMEDVLDHLPPELTAFMTAIAVVDKVSPELAAELAGLSEVREARALIERIAQQQLFFTARDHAQRWYAFHPLFREQLLRRVAAAPGPGAAAMHRRAADWFASRESWPQAVDHALAAGDNARARAWIEQCAMPLLQHGELLTLLSWQGQLRSHVVELPPRLKLAFAWVLAYAMACAEARRLLGEIEAALGADPAGGSEDDRDLHWECTALRALIENVDDDSERAGELARRCLAAGAPRDAWTRNVLLNIVSTTHLRHGQWQDFYAVPPLTLHGDDGSIAPRFAFNVCYRLCYRGIAAHRQGRLDEAGALFEQAMQAGGGDAPPAADGSAQRRAVWVLPAALLAPVRYQQNRIAEAEALVAGSLDLARIMAPLDFVSVAYQTAVRLAARRGDAARVAVLLDDAGHLAHTRSWARLEATMLLERVRLCLLGDRIAEAEACLSRLETLAALARSGDVRKAYLVRDLQVARVWVAIARGDGASLVEALWRRLEAAVATALPLDAAAGAAMLALAQAQAGDEAGALASCRTACEQAVAAQSDRALLDLPLLPDALAPLLARLQAGLSELSPIAPVLATWLAAITGIGQAAPASPVEGQAATAEADALSGRERHILRLVARGQSNKEIARALGIAPNTIKYHLKSVFAKLGVGNRAQAAVVARAYEVS